MLIIVAAGAGLTVGVAVDLDVQRLPQDHLPFVAHSITVMIMAMVTRDLALPAPSGGGPVAVVGFELPQLPPAARCAWAMSSPARFQRHPNDDQLAGLVMGVDDQLPGSPSWQQWVKPPRGRFAFEPCCCWELGRSHRERRALKVVDLARVKINQPQPWTPATLRLGWSHRTDVRSHSAPPGCVGCSRPCIGCGGLSPARLGGRPRSGSAAAFSCVR